MQDELPPKYPPVFVVWYDIAQGELGWRTLDEAFTWADSEDGIVHQTGFVIDDTEDHLLVVDAYFISDDTVGTVTKIPKQVIKKIMYLK